MISKYEKLKRMIFDSEIACQGGHAKCGPGCKVVGFVGKDGIGHW